MKMKSRADKAETETKERKCLMCSRPFQSQGPHNRICPRCVSTQAYRDGQPPGHF